DDSLEASGRTTRDRGERPRATSGAATGGVKVHEAQAWIVPARRPRPPVFEDLVGPLEPAQDVPLRQPLALPGAVRPPGCLVAARLRDDAGGVEGVDVELATERIREVLGEELAQELVHVARQRELPGLAGRRVHAELDGDEERVYACLVDLRSQARGGPRV